MKTKWLLLVGAALALLLAPRRVEATGACTAARFHDWQDGGCNQNFAGVGGAPSGRSNPGGNQSSCNGDCGMPRWRVSEPYESLWISDKPLSYTLSSGQEMSFQLYYRQRYQLPGLDEIPNFHTDCNGGFATRLGNDYYATFARVGGITNAAWAHNWMMDIIFWDTNSETSVCTAVASPPMYSLGYEALVFRPEGDVQYYSFPSSLQDARSQVSLVPLSGLYYPTVSSQTADTNGIYWGNSTNGFRLAYPDGSQDIFGFTPSAPLLAGPSTHRALLTQRSDPQGRITQVGYEYAINGTLLGYRVRYVVDPDGRTNTFLYATNNCNLFYNQPAPNPWQLIEVDDPYGRKVQLGYAVQLYGTTADYGLLTSITDAAGLTSSVQYQARTVTNTYYLGTCSGATGTEQNWLVRRHR